MKVWKARAQAEGKTLEQYKQELIARGEWSPTETRQEHIERHLPGSAHQDTLNNGWEEAKSPTSLVSEGVGFEGLLMQVGYSMLETSPAVTRQYQDGNRVVKLTYSGDDNRIEVTILHPRKEGYEVVTTYDSVTVGDVVDKLRGCWH